VSESVVVIGVGNVDRGDDAAGRRVAAALRRVVPEGTTVVESDGDPTAIMDAWEGADRAVLVDTMVSGSPPGTVRRFDATTTPLPIAAHFVSSHGMGAAEAVEMARTLGRLPKRLLVYGIEGKRFRPGDPICQSVADAVDVAKGMVLAEVADA
jgi:hydrogenase maturation protease